jgi:glucosamine--fructose-6-phosphate aminotransferase (isomerizing)
MCGIVGYLGPKEVVPLLLDGLRRLEYRGYDSAGVAVLENSHLETVRAEGKLDRLVKKLEGHALHGTYGIGHTRWATHGVPSERNAHPMVDSRERVAVIHNGIIENFTTSRTTCAPRWRGRWASSRECTRWRLSRPSASVRSSLPGTARRW